VQTPQTNWQPPSELPNLRRAGIIAIDTETCDQGLRAERGSAWPWRGGYVCGINVAWRADGEIRPLYVPLRHPDSENFERENVARWLKDLIAAGVKFTTQNGIYDWGWLGADLGVAMPPSNQLDEIGALATLVDENLFQYSLDALCKQYGLPGKDEMLLRQAIKTAGFASGRKKINAREYIWQLPANFVGPYAEADAVNTLLLFERLNPILDREGTRTAYRLDVDLMPMVHEMRRRGIRGIRVRPSRSAGTCSQNGMPHWPSFQHNMARSLAWTRSMAANGKRRLSINTASSIRARRREIRRSRPAKSGGWPRTPIGCHS
jgi:hypothetical protein